VPEEPHFIAQHDTADVIERTLRNAFGVAVNLTGATLKFSMRLKPGGAVKISALLGTIVDAVNGRVRYEFVAANTDTSGEYEAEFQVEYSDASIQTFPNDGFIPVSIKDDIA
jgi:5-hydroxyisourate hydrolase-like protein (transthyretin family)